MSSSLLKEVGELDINTENCKSFLLVDENETLQVMEEESFLERLGIPSNKAVKVLSIFGNTGDGKSHTLNATFFNGHEVFRTSETQDSCTVGVWAAFDPSLSLILLDTEGLLGATSKQNQRMRLLLKVLAVSDMVVYRTRAERLHNDLFRFLGNASQAYLKHFTSELKAMSDRCGLEVPLSSLGPALLVFHETSNTKLLGCDSRTPGGAEQLLQKRFHQLSLSTEAFNSVEYVGTRTTLPPTNFSGFLEVVCRRASNTSTRSRRPPAIVYNVLKALSMRFNGEITDDRITTSSFFPDEYFSCSNVCLSCGARCTKNMNHLKDNVAHTAKSRCRYTHQYNNKVLICRVCYERGLEVAVNPKTSASTDSKWFGLATYAWSGRQHWIGNQDPEGSVVRPELRHVWLGNEAFLKDNSNGTQRVLDGVNFAIQSVTDYSRGPTKAITAWLTDQVAPEYWRPNSQITECHQCKKPFEDGERKHHCRSCGEGCCDVCSTKTMSVPERGWGSAAVRVCDDCFRTGGNSTDVAGKQLEAAREGRGLMARRITEVAQSTLDAMTSAVEYPLGIVKDVARPDYWVPDHELVKCHHCEKPFAGTTAKHHCRACGLGFCSQCSPELRPVPSRGWDHPVRVCVDCSEKKGEL
ncbi:zinc finger FYVE domain-containing protein 1 isoform X5 [Scyliorhinus canicula]|uniref:zinc finger FYVE domain-containing protein 1 isoform X5 n=1 Tax=Scyliorhinus canicula TaxID=7830 RepID=UPI0018F57960|nr:zinc finger FYVE domain-containing protein 1 isoform X5 [Scyliorhinus canicula]